MDKYEFQIKTEQLEKLLEQREYKTAAKIADSIDWRKVHDVELLMEVAEVYENLERYEDSYEILNMAYDCSPIGRMIVYKMVEVAVKMGDFDEAVELYKNPMHPQLVCLPKLCSSFLEIQASRRSVPGMERSYMKHL